MTERSEHETRLFPGIFITFEGGEGAGKSTHIRFLSEALESHGHEVLCLREPGGTAIGEALREIVLDPDHETMCDEAELLIYEAARAQIIAEVIEPALKRGAVVLCDRFFDSTVAYQVYGRGLDRDLVERANAFASRGIVPGRTILMAVGASAEVGLKRATHHGQADRLERAGSDFHARVNAGFEDIARMDPERVRTVVSAKRKADTARAIFRELSDMFPWMADASVMDDAFFSRIETGAYGNKGARCHPATGSIATPSAQSPSGCVSSSVEVSRG